VVRLALSYSSRERDFSSSPQDLPAGVLVAAVTGLERSTGHGSEAGKPGEHLLLVSLWRIVAPARLTSNVRMAARMSRA